MNKNEFAKMLKEILEDAYHAANTENHKDSFILKFIQEIGAKTEQCPICVQQVDKWRTAARKLAKELNDLFPYWNKEHIADFVHIEIEEFFPKHEECKHYCDARRL